MTVRRAVRHRARRWPGGGLPQRQAHRPELRQTVGENGRPARPAHIHRRVGRLRPTDAAAHRTRSGQGSDLEDRAQEFELPHPYQAAESQDDMFF